MSDGTRIRTLTFLICAICVFGSIRPRLPTGVVAGRSNSTPQEPEAAATFVISGRVVDPHALHPKDAELRLAAPDGDSGAFGKPMAMAADGSFVTPRVKPGIYALEVVRTPHSATERVMLVGFEVVRVGTSDVRDVTVTIRRDIGITGTFKMESDDPSAPWPPHLVVSSWAVVDGRFLDAGVVDGAPGGRFVLRNAFGPRLLRVGYAPARGRRWSPSRVLLDGRDITDVPTDFSAVKGALEVWFTEHPAVLSGVVNDAQGRPIRGAWVLAFSQDPELQHRWSMMSHVVETNRHGAFRFSVLPGRYYIRAQEPSAYVARQAALRRLDALALGAVPVELGRREVKQIALDVR